MKGGKKALLWIAIGLLAIIVLACSTATDSPGENHPDSSLNQQESVSQEMNDTQEEDEPINFDSVMQETDESDGQDNTVSSQEVIQQPAADVHQHQFSEATCTEPKKCVSCGATEGDSKGHHWAEATCVLAKTCSICGATTGSANGHHYANGICSSCGANDPDFVAEEMVWIPTKGGTKYHTKSTCSQMDGPEYVTKTEAINRGFGPCGRCYK